MTSVNCMALWMTSSLSSLKAYQDATVSSAWPGCYKMPDIAQ
jgi:hypothetical protein